MKRKPRPVTVALVVDTDVTRTVVAARADALATVIVVGLSLGTFMTLFVLPAIIAVMVEVFGISLAGDAQPPSSTDETAAETG